MEPYRDILSNDWEVDEEVAGYLYQTAVLARFVAALGMCFAVLSTCKTAYSLVQLVMKYESFIYNSYFLLTVAGAVLWGVLYFSISLFTYRFASRLKLAIRQNDQDAFTACWQQFKLCYRMKGVTFIVYLGLLLIALLF